MVFALFLVCSACRVSKGDYDGCKSRTISAPRNSTLTKSISREKCHYEDGSREKSFTIEESGCWSHTIYYERGREYYPNGRLKTKYHFRGRNETTREYYVTGGLKKKEKIKRMLFSDEQLAKREQDSTVSYAPGVYRVKLKQVDSLTGSVTRSIRSDSLIIRAKF
jgi:hypothetical protein